MLSIGHRLRIVNHPLGSQYPTETDGHDIYSIISILDIAPFVTLMRGEPTSWHCCITDPSGKKG